MAEGRESQQSLSGEQIFRQDPTLRADSQPRRLSSQKPTVWERFSKGMSTGMSTMKRKIPEFFGLGEKNAQEEKKWLQRRAIMMSRARCKMKPGTCTFADMSRGEIPLKVHQTKRAGYDAVDGPPQLSDDDTTDLERRRKKESVLQMAFNGVKGLVKKDKKRFPVTRELSTSRSFRRSRKDSQEGIPMGSPDQLPEDIFADESRKKFSADHVDSTGRGARRIPERDLGAVSVDETEHKRKWGLGIIGRWFQRDIKRDVARRYKDQLLEKTHDHRPYFTYWVTFVQLVVFIVSVSVYGFAPVGVDTVARDQLVLKTSLVPELASIKEKANLWIGPRQADLIHLGAKYSPCMRRDDKILALLAEDRAVERTTGCCINNDKSGCVQATQSGCASVSSFWANCSQASAKPGTKPSNYCVSQTSNINRTSGPVCGLDPRHCKQPSEFFTTLWPDDITKWQICKVPAPSSDPHMSCKIVGRPCCVGIQGQCTITTREHCTFLRGHFHEKAFLCSQVSCLDDICGMIDFANPDYPDQVYRLWLALFLHAGVFHLVITLLFQMIVMRDVEKLTGAIRLAAIYTISGIAGNLASATFLPYQVEAGPAGAQFGVLAMLWVEVLQSWQIIESPGKELGKLAGLTIGLLILGLLPWIDNYAHLVGFINGFFLSFALLPYVTFGTSDRKRKLIGLILSLVFVVLLLVLLFLLFYVVKVYECKGCQYFNCIPFTATFCDNMQVTIGRTQTYS